MPALLVRCPAKINPVLHVLGRRDDGYHELDLEFVPVELHDDLRLERAAGFHLTVEGAPPGDVPVEGNLVLRAALALQEHVGMERLAGARMSLVKRIPSAAGLGGGSSDAAGALLGLCRLHALEVAPADLARLALAVGSDVPYFLVGGRQRGRGRGERLTTLDDLRSTSLLLVRPRVPLRTASVFEELARRRGLPPVSLTLRKTDATLGARPWGGVGSAPTNDLLEPAMGLLPDVGSLLESARAGFPEGTAGMTGSGPTLFIALPEGLDAADVARRARAAFGEGAETLLTRTISSEWFVTHRFAAAGG